MINANTFKELFDYLSFYESIPHHTNNKDIFYIKTNNCNRISNCNTVSLMFRRIEYKLVVDIYFINNDYGFFLSNSKFEVYSYSARKVILTLKPSRLRNFEQVVQKHPFMIHYNEVLINIDIIELHRVLKRLCIIDSEYFK